MNKYFKYFKRFLLYGLKSLLGALLVLSITFCIYFPLETRGIITIQEVSGPSSIWVNWELHIIFTIALAAVVFLIYKIDSFLDSKKVITNEQ